MLFILDNLESPKSCRLYSAVGKKGPVYCTGVTGKAMLAFFAWRQTRDSHRRAIFYPSQQNHTLITHRRQLRSPDLQQVQKTRHFTPIRKSTKMGKKCAAALFSILVTSIAPISGDRLPPFARVTKPKWKKWKVQVNTSRTLFPKRLGACD